MTRLLRSSAFITLLSAAACSGGDDGTSAGESSTGSTSSSSATTSTTGAGSATTSTTSTSAGTDSGTTGTSGTSSSGSSTAPGTTDPGTTAPGTTDPGTTGTTDPGTTGTTDPGTTGMMGTTGMGVDCAMLGPNQCKAEPMCLAIQGQKQNTQKMCLQKVMFYECAPAMACGDAITVACDPMVMPPEPVQFPDTCIPDGWMPCDFPPLDKGC